MTPRFSHVHWSLCNVNHPYIVVHHWWWYITSIWNQSDIIWRCMGKHWCTAPLITDSATIISIVIDQLLTKHHLSWIILLSHSNQAFKQEGGLCLGHKHRSRHNHCFQSFLTKNHSQKGREESLSSTFFETSTAFTLWSRWWCIARWGLIIHLLLSHKVYWCGP